MSDLTKEGVRQLGLERIAKDLNGLARGRLTELTKVRAPEKQLYVMILGNHSAGKSSFINWYVGERIQETKVSIETIEISLIMHGARRSELSGHNCTRHLPFLKELIDRKTKAERFPGLLNNLRIKTSTSKARNFPNMVFIDTPGLADGGLQYRFDVEAVYAWLARHCDLVLVFLDPIGQALCARTNSLIERLVNDSETPEVQFFMTKGDMFTSESDRSKCMCQIV